MATPPTYLRRQPGRESRKARGAIGDYARIPHIPTNRRLPCAAVMASGAYVTAKNGDRLSVLADGGADGVQFVAVVAEVALFAVNSDGGYIIPTGELSAVVTVKSGKMIITVFTSYLIHKIFILSQFKIMPPIKHDSCTKIPDRFKFRCR